jgi:hypothetical protein
MTVSLPEIFSGKNRRTAIVVLQKFRDRVSYGEFRFDTLLKTAGHSLPEDKFCLFETF